MKIGSFVHAVSGEGPVGLLLKALASQDARIKIVVRAANGSASGTIEPALEMSTGEYVALLDHRDKLAPHALAMMADAINRHAEADVFYSDEDKVDGAGHRYDPISNRIGMLSCSRARITSLILAYFGRRWCARCQ